MASSTVVLPALFPPVRIVNGRSSSRVSLNFLNRINLIESINIFPPFSHRSSRKVDTYNSCSAYYTAFMKYHKGGGIANVRFTQGTCFTRLNFLSFSAKSSFSVSFGQIFCFYHFITGCMGKSIFELQKIIQILTGCYDNRSDARKKQ